MVEKCTNRYLIIQKYIICYFILLTCAFALSFFHISYGYWAVDSTIATGHLDFFFNQTYNKNYKNLVINFTTY